MKETGNKTPAPARVTQRAGRKTQKRQFISPMTMGIAVLVIVVALVIYAVWQGIDARNEAASPLEGLETFPNQQQGHEDGQLGYAQTPPVGGIHNPVWQNCGVYTEPVPNENAVHSLEHGAVWITYRPDLPADQVQRLQEITRQSSYRLLSPFPDLPSPIVASAWGYQLKLERADDEGLSSFFERYEQSPLGPEPGATCANGTGQPS
jgi:hypothetical protein